jgi:hypothetical protein
VTVNGGNVSAVNFAATATGSWSISGTITGTTGVAVALSGAATATTTTDSSDNYSFSGLQNGSYTVTPTKAGFTFSPANAAVTVNGANLSGINFTASAAPHVEHLRVRYRDDERNGCAQRGGDRDKDHRCIPEAIVSPVWRMAHTP